MRTFYGSVGSVLALGYFPTKPEWKVPLLKLVTSHVVFVFQDCTEIYHNNIKKGVLHTTTHQVEYSQVVILTKVVQWLELLLARLDEQKYSSVYRGSQYEKKSRSEELWSKMA